ncbi:XRE family transcriptional regulator [Myroides odoratimimus]|uniref:XRE family transcriptional regulator n=1 Tax=Myroides odoratimimus TaxID=76832 RepID=UPI0025769E7C|nr:helix-turn-helix domain-containing protein [Myroides odoratimimus]MDM1093391.1 helix-turn-helix domain-containing protein [Myroides odoratimimus]
MLKIKDIRTEKGLSQDDIVSKTGIPKRTYVNYENETNDIPLKKLQDIATALGVSISELVGEVKPYQENPIYNSDELQKVPTVVTVDSMNQDNIVLVPIQAQAGYLVGYTDPTFLQSLPSYRLPNLNNGIFRMFQIKGSSMFPTLHDHSFVVGQFVENWIEDIKDDRIYVIVSKEDGVVVKRVLNRIVKYSNLYCKSDNRKEYPSFQVDVQDIKEVWHVKMALLIDLPNPADLYDRINEVESEIVYLRDKLLQNIK